VLVVAHSNNAWRFADEVLRTNIDPMPRRPLPRTYIAFALLTLFGMLPAMLVDHNSIHPSAAGLAFIVLLLIGVARGHVSAWALLLVWNVFLVLTVVAVSSGTWLPGTPLILLNGILGLALQLAPSMRTHVGLRRERALTAP
jgi:hypothetical protein